MTALLLLATLASGANLKGTTRTPGSVTVTPIVTLSSPLNAPTLGGPLQLAPVPLAAANAPLPTLSPLPALTAASAAMPLTPAPQAAASAGAAPADGPNLAGRALGVLRDIVMPAAQGDSAEIAEARRQAAEAAALAQAALFDGSGKAHTAEALGIEGLVLKGGDRWLQGGTKLQRLGKGTIGFVDAHPTRDDAVVKTISPSVDQLFAGLDYETAVNADEAAARVLAGAGVGPLVFGSVEKDRRRLSVRERINGKTMQKLIDERGFGEEEERLVLEMVGRMAAAGVLVTDLKPENIMLGETKRVPGRRAWAIDGGLIEKFDPALDQAGRETAVLDLPFVIAVRQDFSNGKMVESHRSLRYYIREGRIDSSPMSPWKRLLRGIYNAYFKGPAVGGGIR